LEALSCTDDEDLLKEFMDLSFDEEFIKTQDGRFIFKNVGRKYNSDIAWKYFKINLDKILDKFTHRTNTILSYSTSLFSSENDLTELINFKQEIKDDKRYNFLNKNLESIIKKTKSWINTMEMFEDLIFDELVERGY